MKTAYIIRHGKSSWEYPELSDRERPLKPRGERDGKIMGNLINDLGIQPDLFISSPANRAFSTAKIIAKETGYDVKDIQRDDRLYFEGIEAILAILRNLDNNKDTVFVFGHNPDFTSFANRFSKTHIGNVPTTGMVGIDFNITSWKDIHIDNGSLKLFEYPSKHR